MPAIWSAARSKDFESIAKDLDRQVATHACEQFIETHLNGLGELVIVAGQFTHCVDLLDQGVLREVWIGPLFLWLEDNEGIGGIRRHRSVAISAVPVFEKTKATCGNALTVFSISICMACDCARLVLECAVRAWRHFFSSSVGMNTGPDGRTQHRGGEHEGRTYHNRQRTFDRKPQQRRVGGLQLPNDRIVAFGDATSNEYGNQRRHEGQRQYERREEGEDDGQRHRLKHFAFDPAKGQQRHLDHDDDCLTVHGRTDHFLGGAAHGFQTLGKRKCAPLGLRPGVRRGAAVYFPR